MLQRRRGYLHARPDGPAAAAQLEREGHVMLRGVLGPDEVDELRRDVERVFDEYPPDIRRPESDFVAWDEFRYETVNRSAVVQRVVGHRDILDVLEPLVGEDCHLIANSSWRNPAGREATHGGGKWHIDAGPHVPRPVGTQWPEEIPYPVFVVAAHILIDPMPLSCGPTGVIPRSHTSGQAPPSDRLDDVDLDYDGVGVLPLVGEAGDVALFVSDVWHRRLPPDPGGPGRFFVQAHYGRRDIAQRLHTTETTNQASAEAIARATTPRERTLIGLHPAFFYDG